MKKTNNTISFCLTIARIGSAGMLSAFIAFAPIYNIAKAADNDTSSWLIGDAEATESAQTVGSFGSETDSKAQEVVIVKDSDGDSYNSEGPFPMKRTFIISAYYSPIAGQAKYVTGSYAGDIRLNGGGVHGADGTNVYAGMIAAPKNYPFGTKIDIPGIGVTAVHDRGGAIVNIGQRGHAYDRLDVWMGYGDAGLKRALKWGKRTVTTTVYGINSSIIENASFEGYSATEKNGTTANNTSSSVTAETKKDVNFVSNLAYGTVSEDVAKVQTILKNLNYYDGEINSKFDAKTLAAVKKFQLDYDIIYTENDYGAGYIGPKTIKVLASKMNVTVANAAEETILPVGAFVRDLKPGDSGDDVRELQEELKKLNLFGVEVTGNYGETTEHAVFKFQQTQRLVGDKNSAGAGIFGTKTRTSLNLLISERERINKMRKDVI